MQNWIRYGISALPASGLLATLSGLIPGAWTDPSVDPGGFARAAGNIALANMVGIPIAVLLPIGTLALYLSLAGTPSEKWALGALLLLFAGLGLFMLFIGILAFVAPVLGRDYLNGDTNAINAITESARISNPSALVFGATAILLLFLSSLFLAVAIWRSRKMPKWSGIMYAVATPLWIDPLYVYQPIVAIVGGILLISSGLWIAISMITNRLLKDELSLFGQARPPSCSLWRDSSGSHVGSLDPCQLDETRIRSA
jgi:hypothetical protein